MARAGASVGLAAWLKLWVWAANGGPPSGRYRVQRWGGKFLWENVFSEVIVHFIAGGGRGRIS